MAEVHKKASLSGDPNLKTRQSLIEVDPGSSVSGSPAAGVHGKNDRHYGTMHDRTKKLGHRRVNEDGSVTYKKKTTTELMSAIQLGIGQSITSLSSKPKRDLLLQDFSIVETVFFPKDGSSSTPPHEYSDFRFKTYAPVAFRYFRELFGIQPDDFLISLSNYPLKELSNPGASGSIFYITEDDEFIIKTVSNKEADFLQKLLPGYYMNLNQNPRTLLPKFYGLFCYQCGGKNIRFVVMNNLLPMSIKMHEKYDLKGSTYKRKASKQERSKKSPTLKDLDYQGLHPEGIMLEADTFSALSKTIERDCRVLQSFQIMDYSLLMSVHNLDQAMKERESLKESEHDSPAGQSATASSGDGGGGGGKITRGRSIHQRLAQFSTTMEAIHAKSEPLEIDEDEVPSGGIPARNFKGDRLLLFIGIIDILQNYRLAKKLEHAVKSIVHDGDTISVHRPGFYAQRFQSFFTSTVFKKIPSPMKHSPIQKKSLATAPIATSTTTTAAANDKGGRPDVLPSATPPPTSSMADLNLTTGHDKPTNSSGSLPVSMEMTRHVISPAHLIGSFTSTSTPTHTSFTEGTPSYTASSPSCSMNSLSTPCHVVEPQNINEATPHSDWIGQRSALVDQSDRQKTFEGTDVDEIDQSQISSLSREVTATISRLYNQIDDENTTTSNSTTTTTTTTSAAASTTAAAATTQAATTTTATTDATTISNDSISIPGAVVSATKL
ncbi:hypothetical protein HELRODRAFT_194206 [Helobdella robusta]|uniref:PIPK domain-containing protein n=1 Tax=Helobdella robusta TaxID=6412 RepID=T1FVT0_HELRO|nr:hypothetical protein HELRODRAFT_194206 [Helobdella robusta]ESN92482.1 hypothetical protein HELRODRAFT_194206 [Helobdella robusta]